MPDLNTLMNTPTTSCFNFVVGGKKFQFYLQDNRVYYNNDEEIGYIREIAPHYYRFTEKSPDGEIVPFAASAITIKKIAANNNRIFAYGKTNDGKNKFFWAQLADEYPDEPGQKRVSIPGIYVRKNMNKKKKISKNWKAVWEMAEKYNHPVLFLFNKKEFLEKKVAPIIRILLTDFLFNKIGKEADKMIKKMTHFSTGDPRFFNYALQRLDQSPLLSSLKILRLLSIPLKVLLIIFAAFFDRIISFILKIFTNRIDQLITDILLVGMFFEDNVPVIVRKMTWYEIDPQAPSDMVSADTFPIKTILGKVMDFVRIFLKGKDLDSFGKKWNLIEKDILSEQEKGEEKCPGAKAKGYYNLGLEEVEVLGIGVANPHRYNHCKKAHGGEIQAYLYPFGIEENPGDGIAQIFNTVKKELRSRGVDDRYNKLLCLVEDLYLQFPNLKVMDANSFNDGTCNFFILFKDLSDNKCRVAWCDEQEYYSEQWRYLHPKDRYYKKFGKYFSIFPVIEKYHWIPVCMLQKLGGPLEEFYSKYKNMPDGNKVFIQDLLKKMNIVSKKYGCQPLFENDIFKIDTIDETFISTFFRFLGNPLSYIQFFINGIVELLGETKEFNTSFKDGLPEIRKVYKESIIKMEEFEEDFEKYYPEFDDSSCLAVSKYPVMIASKSGLYSISYMWGTTDWRWMKRNYPEGRQVKSIDFNTLQIRDDMTVLLKGVYNMETSDNTLREIEGYWYHKYLPVNIQKTSYWKDPYSKKSFKPGWRFVRTEVFKVMDQFYSFGIYENRRVRQYYAIKGIDDRCTYFVIKVKGILDTSELPISRNQVDHFQEKWKKELIQFLKENPDSEWEFESLGSDNYYPINPILDNYGPYPLTDTARYNPYRPCLKIIIPPDLDIAVFAHPRDDDLKADVRDRLNKPGFWKSKETGFVLKLDFQEQGHDNAQPAVEEVIIKKVRDKLILSFNLDLTTDDNTIRFISLGCIYNNFPLILYYKAEVKRTTGINTIEFSWPPEKIRNSELVEEALKAENLRILYNECFKPAADMTMGTSVWFEDWLGHKNTPDRMKFVVDF